MDSDTKRFDRYIDAISGELGHVDRIAPFRSYCTGLLLPGERKSVEPMAALIDPTNVRKSHQSLHHFVSTSAWDRSESGETVFDAIGHQQSLAHRRHPAHRRTGRSVRAQAEGGCSE